MFTWYPQPGGKRSVRVGPYVSADEANAALWKALDELDYTPPRWWQYWRWGERKPPPAPEPFPAP